MHRTIDIEALCAEKGLRITEQRRTIARIIGESADHPDVETLHERAAAIDPNISIATVYRTVRLFEEAGILERHEFGNGRSRYEAVSDEHHDHLIDVESGSVVEFHDEELELLKARVAERLGFKLVDHRLELYGVPLDRDR
ncbi:Fur family transcriptional regulator [Sphingomonas humi]|uniref:Ferric uptake regulation protein n=1 Tax=Sphingomonas humi TaxID=335630 RepID=A0ABP7RYV4_9SPHN